MIEYKAISYDVKQYMNIHISIYTYIYIYIPLLNSIEKCSTSLLVDWN